MRAMLRIASLALAFALLALASPAWSAQVTTARIGQHPQFTRVVFQLDTQAGYRLERSVGPDGRPVVVVTLAATLAPDAPRRIRSSSSLLESVTLEQPDSQTVATIHLRGQARPVKEMILTNPPRIVLDVVGADTALAARAAKPKAPPEPAPVAKPPEAEPKPGPVAKTPAEAKPKPAPVAKPTEPKPAPRAEAPKPAPEPAPVAEAPEAAEPLQESEAEAAAREAMERRLAAVREAAEQRKEQLEEQKQRELEERKAAQERFAEQRRHQQEEQAAPPPPRPAPRAPEAEGSRAYLIGAVGGLLLFAVVLAIVMIRRRTLPKDLDVSAFSDEEGGAAPAVGEHARETAPGSSEPLVAAGPSTKPPLSAPGLFEESEEESEKGESEMEPQDLPIEHNEPFTASAGPSADVSGVIADLERRMSALEAKLQESNAARERLERQVAAQSEELRVQRAAIARTQRALRGLSRSEEEQATEPALRD